MTKTEERGFWAGIDAKYVVGSVSAVAIAALGLLGPVTQYIADTNKQLAEEKQRGHVQRMDFLSQLMKAQELKDERVRVLARLDVLKLLKATVVRDDPLRAYVDEQLEDAQVQLTALLELQRATLDAAAQDKKSSGAAGSSATGVDPAAQQRLEGARSKVMERVLVTSDARAATVAQHDRCRRIAAVAVAAKVAEEDAIRECEKADGGARSWQARVGNVIVQCSCLDS